MLIAICFVKQPAGSVAFCFELIPTKLNGLPCARLSLSEVKEGVKKQQMSHVIPPGI